MTRRLGIAIAVVGLLTVSCSGGDDAEAGSPGTPDASRPSDGGEADEVAPDDEVAALGTWDDPLPVGTPVTLTGWDVTVGGSYATTDALDPALTEAEPGMTHLVVEVAATRTGDAPDSLASSVSLSVMGGDGVEVSQPCATPDGLSMSADVAPDSEISGTHCAYIPEDAAEGAAWIVSEQGSDVEAYVATE